MKNIQFYGMLLAVFICCSAFSFKKKYTGKPVYMVGVSASFSDSLVYFTDIQLVDSVFLDKEGFLPQRQQYSYQLKSYMENSAGMTQRTCFVYFDVNKSKLEKNIKKLRDKYQKGGKNIIRQVSEDFKFTKAEVY